MKHYYNEIEPYAVQWLRNLMAEGLIPAGDIDTRSIEDVRPSDLAGYVQCHFFAGIGGWPLALALAGWPVDRPVWTGSCPCQPFSVAGKGDGAADKRHLWPAWFHLISQQRPAVVFGEQVAAAVGHQWLDGVCSDLEGQDYGVGAAVLPACAVGAPHRRDRLWFVADADRSGLGTGGREGLHSERQARAFAAQLDGDSLAYARCKGLAQREREPGILRTVGGEPQGEDASDDVGASHVAHAQELGSSRGYAATIQRPAVARRQAEQLERCGRRAWDGAGWIIGHDGKSRRTPEPSIRLLAHGIPARVGRLRAYGNAIVPQVAAEFIQAYAEARGLMLEQMELAA